MVSSTHVCFAFVYGISSAFVSYALDIVGGPREKNKQQLEHHVHIFTVIIRISNGFICCLSK